MRSLHTTNGIKYLPQVVDSLNKSPNATLGGYRYVKIWPPDGKVQKFHSAPLVEKFTN